MKPAHLAVFGVALVIAAFALYQYGADLSSRSLDATYDCLDRTMRGLDCPPSGPNGGAWQMFGLVVGLGGLVALLVAYGRRRNPGE